MWRLWIGLGLIVIIGFSIPDNKNEVLDELSQRSPGGLTVHWHADTGTPALLKGRLSQPSRHTPQWVAIEFFYDVRTLYELENPEEDLAVVARKKTVAGTTKLLFQHMLFGTPVWGDRLEMVVDRQGVVRSVRGRYYPGLEQKLFHRQAHPSLSPEQAVQSAKRVLDGRSFGSRPSVKLYYLPARDGIPLVYVINERYFVHALTGDIIQP